MAGGQAAAGSAGSSLLRSCVCECVRVCERELMPGCSLPVTPGPRGCITLPGELGRVTGTSGETWASLPPTPMAGAALVHTGSKARVVFP